MRILVGIDHHDSAHAIDLLKGLRFGGAQLLLLHVIESPVAAMPWSVSCPDDPLRALFEEWERQGREELQNASSALEQTGYGVETDLAYGDAARSLLETAEKWGANLIATGSSRQGEWGSLFYGSVTKALTADAKQSILVAKSKPQSQNGLTAVLATDHSPYCERCMDEFLRWDVQGIRRAVVLSSLELRSGRAHQALEGATKSALKELQVKNDALCERLRGRGVSCESVAVIEKPTAAIDRVMSAQNADLLVLGARGHGFWERLRLGSVSHYEVIATAHSTLVIRV